MLAKVNLRGGGEHDEHSGGIVVLCVGVHRDCAHPSFQNLLLCVQTVVVIMWFSWLGPWEPATGSTDRTNNRQFPRRRPVPSVTLLTPVTTAAGLTGPHLRRRSPKIATVGASVPVSRGETGPRWCSGRRESAVVARAG